MDDEIRERLARIESMLGTLLAAWERFAPVVERFARSPFFGGGRSRGTT